MADLIERSEIVKVAEHAYHEWELAMVGAETTRQVNKVYKMQELCKAVEAVAKAAPAVDAKPVIHAHWEYNFDPCARIVAQAYCSNCGEVSMDGCGTEANYCPHCGAKMDEEESI